MPEEGSGARVVRNTLANGAGQFLSVLISLVMTPFLIDGLGVEAYGVFVLALTLTFFGGYAALADLGVEGAAVRYIAEARSDRDVAGVNDTVSTTAAFFGAVALVLTPLLVLLSGVLVDVFSISGELKEPARLTFALVAAQLLFDLPSRAFFAALGGSQRFVVFQAIEVTRALVQAALFAAILIANPEIQLLGAAMVASSAVVLLLAWVASHRAMPELHVSPANVKREVLRRLVTFGGGLLALRVMGTFYRQMDKVIIGTVLGVRFVTPYDVANKIHSGAALVQSVASSALLPATAYARAQRDVLRDLYLRGSSYTVAITLPVIAAGFIFAEDLIRTWVGESLTDDATAATRLFMVYLAIVLPHVVGVSILTGLGKLRWVLVNAAGVLVVNLGLSIALVSPLGIEGVVIGTVAANALSFPFLLVLLTREFEVGIGEWFSAIILPNLPGLGLQAATAAPLLWLAGQTGRLFAVGGLFLISVAVSVAAYLALGLARDQRRLLLTTLRSAVGLRPAT
jgi:O-antigen/teichoic acid export membrane protein